MEVKIPFTGRCQKIVSKKDGRVWNKIEGYGVGNWYIFLCLSKKVKVPDSIEGKTVTAIFKIGIDKLFKPYLRLDRFDV